MEKKSAAEWNADNAEADANVKEEFIRLLTLLRNGESIQLGRFSENHEESTQADHLAVEVDDAILLLKEDWGWNLDPRVETLAERSVRLERELHEVRLEGGGIEGSEELCLQCAFEELDALQSGLIKGRFDSRTGIDCPVNCKGCGKAQFPPAYVWNWIKED